MYSTKKDCAHRRRREAMEIVEERREEKGDHGGREEIRGGNEGEGKR
jgi:hypothetical protein